MNTKNIFENILFEKLHADQRNRLKKAFPELNSLNHSYFLSLFTYLSRIPEKFYCDSSFQEYGAFFNDAFRDKKVELISILNSNVSEINKALLVVNNINLENCHDVYKHKNEYSSMYYIDKVLAPAYLKLLEGAFYPLIYILACQSRIDRGKGLDGLDLFNCVEELTRFSSLSCVNVYDNTIRNGIAHGGITYKNNEITFQDKKGNTVSLLEREFVEKFDKLVDVLNGLCFSLKLFFIKHFSEGINIPQQLMLEELKAVTENFWWSIEGTLNSQTVDNKSQLIVYVNVKTIDILKVFYYSFMTATLCEQYSPGYNRYFIAMTSNVAHKGFAAFDGQKLHLLQTKQNKTMEDYKTTLIDDLVFYMPKIKLPKIFCKFETYLKVLKMAFQNGKQEYLKQLSLLEFDVRDVSIHRNGLKVVLDGKIFIKNIDKDVKEKVKRNGKRIIRSALKVARKRNKSFVLKNLPLGYARIGVFKTDLRIRKLKNYGLGEDLIGTVELKNIKRIKAPDIIGATIENFSSLRFAWNKAWIDSQDL